MQNTENNCFRPWMEYLITDECLPDTPKWDGTIWSNLLESAYRNDFGYIVDVDGVIFKVDSMDKVTNVSRLMSWGEVERFGLNSKTRPIFRAAWITNATDQYIQYFSPVGHGIEMFSMLDGFGPDGRTTLPLLPFPMLKTQNDEFIPYIPSVEDLMAKDWIIAKWTLSEVRDEAIEKIKKASIKVLDAINDTNDESDGCEKCDEKDTCSDYIEAQRLKMEGTIKEDTSIKDDGQFVKLTWWPCTDDKKIVSDSFKDFNGFIQWFELVIGDEGNGNKGTYHLIQKSNSSDEYIYDIHIKISDLDAGIEFIENQTFEDYMPLNVKLDMNIRHLKHRIIQEKEALKQTNQSNQTKLREVNIEEEDSMAEVVRKLLNLDSSFDIKVVNLGTNITDISVKDLAEFKLKKIKKIKQFNKR